MTDDSTRVPFWRAAPVIAHRGKRKLLIAYDGSDERSVGFPIPFTASSLRRLARRIDSPSQASCALLRARDGFPRLRTTGLLQCTRGRGHFVPEVVSVEKQDTSGDVAVDRPENRFYVGRICVKIRET